MNKKILLIDDDESIADIIQILLTEEGYNVVSYAEGLNIEQKVNEHKPDLLVIDYLLPGKNGAQITESLRNNKATKNLPIVMIAANQIYKNIAKKAGVNDFLEKPFDIYDFLNTVKRYV